MESLNVVFTGKDTVEARREPLAEIGPNQLLVETTRALISTGTELIVLEQKFEPGTHWAGWATFPFYPGYSNVGVVRAIGTNVEGWKIGDRIASRKGHRQFHLVNVGGEETHVPDGVSDEDATWFALAGITQTGVRRAAHKLGDSVVIIGAGVLGLLVTQYVKLSGAREIIVIDTAAPRLELARAHGATQTLPMSVSDARERVLALTDGEGADVVYDITGHPAVFSSALGLVKRFGTLLLLGDTGTPSEQRLSIDVVLRGVKIVGAHDGYGAQGFGDEGQWNKSAMYSLFFNYVARGLMRVDDLVTHRYAPQRASEAYQMLRTDRSSAMGVIFDFSQL